MDTGAVLENLAQVYKVNPDEFRNLVILLGLATLITRSPLPEVTRIGKLHSISYVRADNNKVYEHIFHKPLPKLVSYDNQLLIPRGQSKYKVISIKGIAQLDG